MAAALLAAAIAVGGCGGSGGAPAAGQPAPAVERGQLSAPTLAANRANYAFTSAAASYRLDLTAMRTTLASWRGRADLATARLFAVTAARQLDRDRQQVAQRPFHGPAVARWVAETKRLDRLVRGGPRDASAVSAWLAQIDAAIATLARVGPQL